MTNATDANVQAALAGAAQASPAQRGSAINLLQQRAAGVGSGNAQQAGATRAGENAAGVNVYGQQLGTLRGQQLGMGVANQQAGLANTQLNAGLTLANQAAMRQMLAGAGQAATAFGSNGQGQGNPFQGQDFSGTDNAVSSAIQNVGGEDSSGSMGQGDFGSDSSGGLYGAEGGMVPDKRAADFVEAVHRKYPRTARKDDMRA